MKTKLKSIVLVLGVVLGIGLMAPAGAYASVIADQCAGVTDSAVCKGQDAQYPDLAKNIINTLLFVVGAISVVMIIGGGIMYAISAGDSAQVTRAKNVVTYAVVGLIVAVLALAIVQFVTSTFIKK